MTLLVYVNVLQAIIFERWRKFKIEKLYEKHVDRSLRIEVSQMFFQVKDGEGPNKFIRFFCNCNKYCLDLSEKHCCEDSKFEGKLRTKRLCGIFCLLIIALVIGLGFL